MAQSIFNVIAKDPKEQHISENVRQPRVHEHRSDEREVNRNGGGLQPRHLNVLAGEGLHENAIPRDDVAAANYFTGNG